MVDFFGLLRSDSLSCMYFIGLEVWQGKFFLLQSTEFGLPSPERLQEWMRSREGLDTPTAHVPSGESCQDSGGGDYRSPRLPRPPRKFPESLGLGEWGL